ncbi:MFS transporter [Amycolatopsis sp. NPDC049159]|uniref:MFS transporter n=1 Tax=Amycolatopsis sp. NPDC049159 TaxID=3157210 RepID=UPI0033F3D990
MAQTAGPVRAAPRPLVFVLAGTMLLDALEVSVLVPVLPALAGAFGAGPGQAQWLLTAFAAGFGAVLPAGPWLAARFGTRRVYLAALLAFAAASVVAGVTGDFAVLVAARLVKGACAALTAPGGLAVLTAAVPEGDRQRRAVALYAAFGAAGFTTGLLVSGALAGAGLRWVLLFPAPVALVLAGLAAAVVPPDAPRAPVAAFPRGLARNGPFARSAFGAAALNGTYLTTLLVTTYALHERGWSPLAVAAGCLPACLPVALTSPVTARLVAAIGTARLIAAGAVAAAAGYAWQLLPLPGDGYPRLAPTLVLAGLGFVFAFGALNVQAVAALPAAARARAVPVYQSCVQFGAVAVVLAGVAVAGLDGPVWTVVTAVGGAGAAVALAGWRRASAESRGGSR